MADADATRGLTTVVFADVEASTQLLDRVGDSSGLAAVLRQLDLVAEQLEAYGGRTVKSLGDGFLSTFASPRQAVSFALAAQRELADTYPRVRFGINTGEDDAVDTDPLGAAANAAARIAARAAGGEVLVSDVVRQLAGGSPAIRFLDRGRCRLRGSSERWRLWVAVDSTSDELDIVTIGRVSELASISELLRETTIGAGAVMVIEGEAGIGKSHLLRDSVASARRSGMAIVEVMGDELVRRPGGVAHGLLDQMSAPCPVGTRLRDLLAAPIGDQPEDLRYAVIEASVDVAEELARARPLLIAVEDLHWSDDLSIGILAALASRTGVSRFSVIATMRPSPRQPGVDRLLERIRAGAGTHMRLGSLDDIDVHALASSVTGAAPGQSLRLRLGVTAGNPLYVVELLRSLDDTGSLRVEAGVAEVAADAEVPTSLHDTLVSRLSWLPPETNETLRFASLLGTSFTIRDLATITGRRVVDVAGWLRDASLAGLVVGDGERLTFRHELVRDAVYHHMLPAERRDLHRAAGRALASTDAPTQQVAEQYARGARPGDVEAISWLERAAIETLRVSPTTAVALLEEAVSLAPTAWPGAASIRTRMIEPLALCGRFDEAQAIASSVLAAAPAPDVEFAALRGLSSVYGNRGDVAATIELLQRAVGAAGAPADEARRLRCLGAQLSFLIGAMSADDARQLADDTLANGLQTQDRTTQCIAHQVLGVIAGATGYGVAARDHLASAVAIYDSGQVTDASYLIPDTFYAGSLLELDALDEAKVVAEDARSRAEHHGKPVLLPMAFAVTAVANFSAGRWDDALAEIEAGVTVMDDTGDINFVLYYDALAAKIAIRRGDLVGAQERLAKGGQRLTDGASLFGVEWLFSTQAELLEAQQQPDAAFEVAATVWAQTSSIRYFFGHRSRGVTLVRLAAATGHSEVAETVTCDLEEGERRSPATGAAAAAQVCRGIVDHDPDAALQALAQYRTTGLRTDLAACAEIAATLLADADRRDEAIGVLREAAAVYTDASASADAGRVHTLLRELGAPDRPRRLTRATFGWDSLTAMELVVSQLAAEGLTNPEIGARLYISRRTVETHLSHVYRKLALSNRMQLIAELSRRPVAT